MPQCVPHCGQVTAAKGQLGKMCHCELCWGRLSILEEPTQEKKVRLKMELMGYSTCGWYRESLIFQQCLLKEEFRLHMQVCKLSAIT